MRGLIEIDYMGKEEWEGFLEFLRKNIDNKIIKQSIKDLGVDFYLDGQTIRLVKSGKEIADIKRMGNRKEVYVLPLASEETLKKSIASIARIFFSRLIHVAVG